MPLTTLFSIKNQLSKGVLIGLPVLSLSIMPVYALPAEQIPDGSTESELKQTQSQLKTDLQNEDLENEDLEKEQLKKELHTPQWAEQYIHQHHSYLLDNSQADHVLAFYYFGSFQGFTIFGMERVKGDDYESHNTVLVFENTILKGYYQELTVFPAGVSEEGEVFFPPNHAAVDNIDLANSIYPDIQFKPEIERFKKGYLKRLPSKSTFIPNAQLKASEDKLKP